MDGGGGMTHFFPPLKGSATIQAKNPDTVIHVVLAGASITAPATIPSGIAMPAFAQTLNNRQITDVVNYVRNSWGNRSASVQMLTVSNIRKILRKPNPRKP